MLIKFNVSNFLSFDEMVDFSMIPSIKNTNTESIMTINQIDILRFGVVYGANASGKSNLIRALEFVQSVLFNGLTYNYTTMYCRNKEGNKHRLSEFAYTFTINDKFFNYGFSAYLAKGIIDEEWIYQINPKTNHNKLLFRRKYNNENDKYQFDDVLSSSFSKNAKSRMKTYMLDYEKKKKELFLANFLDKEMGEDKELLFFSEVCEWVASVLDINYPHMPIHNLTYLSKVKIEDISNILSKLDTGIQRMVLKKITLEELNYRIKNKEVFEDILNNISNDLSLDQEINGVLRSSKELFFLKGTSFDDLEITELEIYHKKSSEPFQFRDESDGTRRLFDLLDILFGDDNIVYIIDEIERSLHPILLYEFIVLFKERFKQKNVQLIFTTHETFIMKQELFRRDEVWFIEKGVENQSKLYSLDIFKQRIDKRLEPNYLEGKYGAIPVIKKMYTEEIVDATNHSHPIE